MKSLLMPVGMRAVEQGSGPFWSPAVVRSMSCLLEKHPSCPTTSNQKGLCRWPDDEQLVCQCESGSRKREDHSSRLREPLSSTAGRLPVGGSEVIHVWNQSRSLPIDRAEGSCPCKGQLLTR